MRNKLLTYASAVAIGVIAAVQSQAVMLEGEVNFVGTALLDSPPATATSVTFGTALVVSASDDFALLAPGIATFNPLTFGAPGTTGPNVVSPLWASVAPAGWGFDLASIVSNTYDGATRALTGIGSVFAPGFDSTPGKWSISFTGGTLINVGFSSNTTAEPRTGGGNTVPDSGATLSLLGLGLIGLFFARRRAAQ